MRPSTPRRSCRGILPGPPAAPPLAPAPPPFRIVPLFVAPLLPLASVAALLLVQLVFKNDHAHPHTHDERALWQTNVLWNIVIVYLALQAVAPMLHHAAHRAFDSLVIDVGLVVDFVVLWTVAATCLVPIHMHVAAGDVPTVRVGYAVSLYALLALLFGINVGLFVRLVGHAEAAAAAR